MRGGACYQHVGVQHRHLHVERRDKITCSQAPRIWEQVGGGAKTHVWVEPTCPGQSLVTFIT